MSPSATPPWEQAAEVVRWEEAGQHIWLSSHDRFKHLMGRCLGLVAAEAEQAGVPLAEGLASRIGNLDGRSLARLLLAPNTAHHLRWSGAISTEAKCAFLDASLRAEETRAGRVEVPGLWSALGDLETGAASRAARLATGAVVDFDSPDRLLGDGFPLEETRTQPLWPPEARTAWLAELDAALELIAAVHPQIIDFIGAFTRVVTPRIMPGAGFGSSSTLTFPGRTIVINPPAAADGPEALMETLVHEAMHTFIYQLEAEDWWVRLDLTSDGEGPRITSPWSGNKLPLHAYVHACFVWQGLYRFWERALEQRVLPRGVIEQRMYRSARGFLQAEVGRPLRDHAELLRPGLDETCAGFGEELRREFQCDA